MKRMIALAMGALLIMACSTENSSSGGTAVTGIEIDQPYLSLVSEGGTDVTLTATVTPTKAANKEVVWASDDEDVVTVSQKGVVHVVALGDTTITATTKDGSIEATCAVSVVLPIYNVTGVTLDQDSLNLILNGASASLVATIAPSNATVKTIVWTSSDDSIATVSSKGVVTPSTTDTGKVTITATTQDGGFTDTCEVTVAKQAVTSVVIGDSDNADVSSLTFALNNNGVTQTHALTAAVAPSDASYPAVTWQSSAPTVASVTSAGLVTAIGVGTATITCYDTDDNAIYDTCEVTVNAIKATGVTLSQSSGEVCLIGGVGSTLSLTSTVTPTFATDTSVTWTSSDAAIATVSTAGLVTAVGTGTATITATTNDGTNLSATCAITVVIPTAVTSAAIGQRYDGALVLTWTDPTVTTSLSSILVSCVSDSSVSSQTIAFGTKKATFTGLTSGTSYSFIIAIYSSTGTVAYGSLVTATAKVMTAVTLLSQGPYAATTSINAYLIPASSTSMIVSTSTTNSSYSYVWIKTAALDGSSTITPTGESSTGTVSTYSLQATDANGCATGTYLYLTTVSSTVTSFATASCALGSASTVSTSYATNGSFFTGAVSSASGNFTHALRLTNASGTYAGGFMLGVTGTTSGSALCYRYAATLGGIAASHWYINQISTAQ